MPRPSKKKRQQWQQRAAIVAVALGLFVIAGLAAHFVPGLKSQAVITLMPEPQCSDRFDNDGDGKNNYPLDPGCSDAQDNQEADSSAGPCDDNTDNDNDGTKDWPQDPGCPAKTDQSELGPAQCDNGIDDDGDFQIDTRDSGCTGPSDTNEGAAACEDALDNDGDGLFDFPDDPGCYAKYDSSELGTTVCDNGIDEDRDGKKDCADPSCSFEGVCTPSYTSESDDVLRSACGDKRDNDGDGTADFTSTAFLGVLMPLLPPDPGCSSALDDSERSLRECDDGFDNDGDGGADVPNDLDCSNPSDNSETLYGRQ